MQSLFRFVLDRLESHRRDLLAHGPAHVTRNVLAGLRQRRQVLAYRLRKAGRRFTLGGEEYPYFAHGYNIAWLCERTVEVPVAWRLAARFQGRRVLEVGNVLSHYFETSHDVLDKYEQAPGVLNEDLVGFRPKEPYDLVLSVSTVEHVGWDEEPKDPAKALAGIETLKGLVAPGGTLFFTFPLGHHPELDRALDEGRLGLARALYLRRVSADNNWAEAGRDAVRGAPYGAPYPRGNVVAFCWYERPR